MFNDWRTHHCTGTHPNSIRPNCENALDSHTPQHTASSQDSIWCSPSDSLFPQFILSELKWKWTVAIEIIWLRMLREGHRKKSTANSLRLHFNVAGSRMGKNASGTKLHKHKKKVWFRSLVGVEWSVRFAFLRRERILDTLCNARNTCFVSGGIASVARFSSIEPGYPFVKHLVTMKPKSL